MPTIQWTLTLGDVVMVFSFILTFLGVVRHIEKMLDFWRVEHELLIADYCHRHNIKVHELPTRAALRTK